MRCCCIRQSFAGWCWCWRIGSVVNDDEVEKFDANAAAAANASSSSSPHHDIVDGARTIIHTDRLTCTLMRCPPPPLLCTSFSCRSPVCRVYPSADSRVRTPAYIDTRIYINIFICLYRQTVLSCTTIQRVQISRLLYINAIHQ